MKKVTQLEDGRRQLSEGFLDVLKSVIKGASHLDTIGDKDVSKAVDDINKSLKILGKAANKVNPETGKTFGQEAVDSIKKSGIKW